MSPAAEAPCRRQFTRRPLQETAAPPPTTQSGLHPCFLYPRSKLPSLLMTQPGPDDRATCLHLLLQGTSFQVAFSLYRCSGYLADWRSDLVSPQPWNSSGTTWMDILHEDCWFFDLFDNGNPHPHFRTFMHSFITHLWCTPVIPDSVLKLIKNTILSLSPKSLQSRRERGQGKASILALARGFKNYKSEKGSKNVMVCPCWDGIFGSSLLANPLAHMLV